MLLCSGARSCSPAEDGSLPAIASASCSWSRKTYEGLIQTQVAKGADERAIGAEHVDLRQLLRHEKPGCDRRSDEAQQKAEPLKCITVTEGQKDGEIDITVRGAWLHTILFEIPVLAIVNGVYFRNVCKNPPWAEGRERLQHKMALVLDAPDLRSSVSPSTERVVGFPTPGTRRWSRR